MSDQIAVDTAALRRQAYAAYLSHMKLVSEQVTAMPTASQVVPVERGETDQQIKKMLEGALATAEALTRSLHQIVDGDQETLKWAADLFDAIEQENTEQAKTFDGHVRK